MREEVLEQISLRRVMEDAADAMLVVDGGGRIVAANAAADRLFGWQAGGLTGQSVETLIPGRLRQSHAALPPGFFARPRSRSMGEDVEILGLRRDGSEVPMEASLTPLAANALVLLTMRDITRHKADEARFRLLLESMEEAVLGLDSAGGLSFINPVALRLLGYAEASELIGRDMHEAIHHSGPDGSPLPADACPIRQALAEGRPLQAEDLFWRKDGTPLEVAYRFRPFPRHGGLEGVISFTDIAGDRQDKERLDHLAHHDALTELPNRLLLRARLDQALQKARRHRHRVALLYLDLDRFKAINDTLGHEAGDRLLKVVARRLVRLLREEDTAARLGGDEFNLVLAEIDEPEDAAVVAEKVIAAVSRPITLNGQRITPSTSVGIALYPDHARTSADLAKAADTALYQAKEEGRHCSRFYAEELTVRTCERLALKQGLRDALERSEFLLHYQPQVDVGTGRVVGAEALLRWRHPAEGLIPPDRFVPVAEDSGLIEPIGEWVLHQVCRDAAAWREAGLPDVRLAVNLSARQLAGGRLLDNLQRLFKEPDNAPTNLQLELEITESVLHSSESIAALQAIKALGVALAIDDFGTGYSALNALHHLPIARLKIDRSFVGNIPGDAAAIAAAVLAMGRSLGLKVIAEGVETENQLAFLRQHGCDEVQGFLFSPPLPADGLAGLLRQGGRLRVAAAGA